MTLEEEIRRAGKAREILTNEIFKEAFRDIEAALLAGIRQAAFTDDKMREKLCMRYDLLHILRDQIQTHMETGMLAEEEIRRKGLLESAQEYFRGQP